VSNPSPPPRTSLLAPPRVSVIVPLYNRLDLTQEFHESLPRTLPADLAWELIYVDDGSTDGTRAWLGALPPPARAILNERNLGYAASNNRGARAATGEFLVLLNNDLVLTRGWLEPMLAAFERFPWAGLIGNIQRDACTGALDHAGVFINGKGKPEHDRTLPRLHRLRAYKKVMALTGACVLVRRQTYLDLGGFDEQYVNGCEDIDLCLRAHLAGHRHYLALRSVIGHHISASRGQQLRDEENCFRLTRVWRDTLVSLAARAWCRDFITNPFDRSFVVDHRLARAALGYHLRLRRRIPPVVQAAVHGAVERELARWRKMFGDA